MQKKTALLMIMGLTLMAFLTTGCLLVSGTFVIVKEFSMTAGSEFYYYQVDITDEPDWEDHKDAVGVEFIITSTEPGDVTFSVFIDDYGTGGGSGIPFSATKIIDDITISPGVTHITYAQSLGFLTGIERLKELTKTGKFDYYGVSSGNDGSTFVITSAKVIATFSASK